MIPSTTSLSAIIQCLNKWTINYSTILKFPPILSSTYMKILFYYLPRYNQNIPTITPNRKKKKKVARNAPSPTTHHPTTHPCCRIDHDARIKESYLVINLLLPIESDETQLPSAVFSFPTRSPVSFLPPSPPPPPPKEAPDDPPAPSPRDFFFDTRGVGGETRREKWSRAPRVLH